MKERVKWIDSTKFLGIFAIYLGHFGTFAGNGYYFVFTYHVPLFFFLSGCMNNYDKESNFFRFICKKVKRLLVPCWIFSGLSIVIYVVLNNSGADEIKEFLIIVAKGLIRNHFFASSLWFLTCLFVIEVVFKIIKLLKNKVLICLVCIALHIIAEKMIYPRPIVEPHWFYNLDSAFYYIIFFALGYVTYPLIQNLFKLDTVKKRVVFSVTGIISFVYAALLFVGIDWLSEFLYGISFVATYTLAIRALLLIWFNLIVGKLLEQVSMFSKIGQDTLYLCGNEYIVKLLVPCFLNVFGLGQILTTTLSIYLYTALLLILSVRFVIPFEKRVVKSIKNCFVLKENV